MARGQIKQAKKSCKNCAYSKTPVTNPEKIKDILDTYDRYNKPFMCHEYGNKAVCAGYAKEKCLDLEREPEMGEFSILPFVDWKKYV